MTMNKRETLKKILDLLKTAMEDMEIELDSSVCTAQQEVIDEIEEEFENTDEEE